MSVETLRANIHEPLTLSGEVFNSNRWREELINIEGATTLLVSWEVSACAAITLVSPRRYHVLLTPRVSHPVLYRLIVLIGAQSFTY